MNSGKSKTTVVYIPGLGDHFDGFRRVCLKLWRLWGVRTVFVPITWYDGDDFETKYNQVATAIRRAATPGRRVIVIGESAGATLALHAADREENISQVVTICGVASRATPISPTIRRRAPALSTAITTLPSRHKVTIHSLRSILDGTIRRKYSIALGAQEHVVWVPGHLLTVALCLTVLAPYVCAIAKSNKK